MIVKNKVLTHPNENSSCDFKIISYGLVHCITVTLKVRLCARFFLLKNLFSAETVLNKN